jgi:hypothetical protein
MKEIWFGIDNCFFISNNKLLKIVRFYEIGWDLRSIDLAEQKKITNLIVSIMDWRLKTKLFKEMWIRKRCESERDVQN